MCRRRGGTRGEEEETGNSPKREGMILNSFIVTAQGLLEKQSSGCMVQGLECVKHIHVCTISGSPLKSPSSYLKVGEC